MQGREQGFESRGRMCPLACEDPNGPGFGEAERQGRCLARQAPERVSGTEYEELMQSLEEALWQDATALGHNECDYLDDLEAAEMEASWQAAEAEGSTPTPCPCCGYHALYCGPGGRVSCKACHLDLQVASLEALRELLAVVLQEHWQRGCNHTPSFQAHRSQAGESTRLWARCQGCGMRVQVL
ncbi:hypothetical protein ACKKBG_A33195 [Auxenochlorella protothecoides x Auxenochlorella symbiontica]